MSWTQCPDPIPGDRSTVDAIDTVPGDAEDFTPMPESTGQPRQIAVGSNLSTDD